MKTQKIIFNLFSDAEIYPDPDKFDPERFSDEEKAARHSYAFLAFGAGPRMCLGNYYYHSKYILVYIIRYK